MNPMKKGHKYKNRNNAAKNTSMHGKQKKSNPTNIILPELRSPSLPKSNQLSTKSNQQSSFKAKLASGTQSPEFPSFMLQQPNRDKYTLKSSIAHANYL